MDKIYWEKYYASQDPSEQPSDFARFCAARYREEYGVIFDIGCGNGRDTLFFASQSIESIGIDQSEVAVIKNMAKKNALKLKTSFQMGDFSSYAYDDFTNMPYSVYSRFTLHAINYEEENRLFQHLNNGVNLSYLLIEARSIRDSLYGQGKEIGPHEFITSHYRRFIDPIVIRKKLEENFIIEFFEESQGFSKTESEDPCLLRIVAKKKKS